ncbi:MAG: hypothetical protein ACKOFE_10570, partial [Bacteroidota bacterium]
MRLKAYEAAMLFYRMEDYRASAVSLKQLLVEYPDLADREKIKWLIIESYYKLASNSIESKKAIRFEQVILAQEALEEEFPNSVYLAQSRAMALEAKAYLTKAPTT